MTGYVCRNVIVWDSERTCASLCDVAIENGRFSKIASAGMLRSASSIFDGKGRIAMLPGFANAHGHAAMTLLRGLGEDLPLMEWLTERIWPVENNLNGDCVYCGTKLAMAEMLATGTTCFADMYFFMDRVAEAALEVGMKCALSRGIVGDTSGEKLAENIALAEKYNGMEGKITVQLGPHAPYTVSLELMKEIASAAKERGLAVHLHWLETEKEWEYSGLKNKITPEDYLTSTGLTDVKHLILAHGVHIRSGALAFYAKDNITIAHNPKSNLKLASGFAPVPQMLKVGVKVALGTDGAASNNRLDMWEEMRFASLIHKAVAKDPAAVKIADVFRMATVTGARAMGFHDTGLIAEGMSADYILVDLDKPNYVGWNRDNLPGYIVYSGSCKDVLKTVVSGKTLYERGEFMTMDLHDVKAKASEAREYISNKK